MSRKVLIALPEPMLNQADMVAVELPPKTELLLAGWL
jgi:hypothetical protein